MADDAALRPRGETHPLRTLRHEAGLTLHALSSRSGVSIRAIQAIETRSVQRPLYPTRRRLLRALGVGWERQRAVFDGAREAAA